MTDSVIKCTTQSSAAGAPDFVVISYTPVAIAHIVGLAKLCVDHNLQHVCIQQIRGLTYEVFTGEDTEFTDPDKLLYNESYEVFCNCPKLTNISVRMSWGAKHTYDTTWTEFTINKELNHAYTT